MASSAGLRKQNLARNKTKLSSDLGQSVFKKSTHHLVVCGVGNAVKDVWLFGDFLGFVDALKKSSPPINGHFVNCYPVGEYFNTTGLTDIKFGRRKEMGDNGWDSDNQIAIYSRWQYEHREFWWEQVRQELWPTAKDEVLRWIENKAQDAKPGSIVTIILIGHGDENGANRLILPIWLPFAPNSKPTFKSALSSKLVHQEHLRKHSVSLV